MIANPVDPNPDVHKPVLALSSAALAGIQVAVRLDSAGGCGWFAFAGLGNRERILRRVRQHEFDPPQVIRPEPVY